MNTEMIVGRFPPPCQRLRARWTPRYGIRRRRFKVTPKVSAPQVIARYRLPAVTPKADCPIFAFAGVWRPTDDGAAYAFLTTGYDGDASTHLVGAIHPKAMPVILHDEDYARWLQAPVEDALTLAIPYPSQLMAVL